MPKNLTSSTNNLYEKDVFAWSQSQAYLLKNKNFNALDVKNLAEEIESLGQSQRDKLESFLRVLMMHMLKVIYQPEKHSRSWDLSIKNSRHRAKKVLKDNPSLKPVIAT